MPGGQEAEINTAEEVYFFLCSPFCYYSDEIEEFKLSFKKYTLNIFYEMYWEILFT